MCHPLEKGATALHIVLALVFGPPYGGFLSCWCTVCTLPCLMCTWNLTTDMCASCLTVDMCSWFNPVVINNGRRSKRDGADDVRVRDSFLCRRAHLYRRRGNIRSCTQHLYEFLCTLICPTPDTDLQLSSSSPPSSPTSSSSLSRTSYNCSYTVSQKIATFPLQLPQLCNSFTATTRKSWCIY